MNDNAHDAWFRAKVLEALNDTRADISDMDVETHFTQRRTLARQTATRSHHAVADRGLDSRKCW